MPSYWDKSPLEPGDRIVILANFDSLQKIETSDRQLPNCKLRVRAIVIKKTEKVWC